MKTLVWRKNTEAETRDIRFKAGGLKLEGNTRNTKRERGEVFLLLIDQYFRLLNSFGIICIVKYHIPTDTHAMSLAYYGF